MVHRRRFVTYMHHGLILALTRTLWACSKSSLTSFLHKPTRMYRKTKYMKFMFVLTGILQKHQVLITGTTTLSKLFFFLKPFCLEYWKQLHLTGIVALSDLANLDKIYPLIQQHNKIFQQLYLPNDGTGIESQWGGFSAPVQTGPGAHPASCTMGTGVFPGVKSGRGVTLSHHPLLVPLSWKGRAIHLLPLWAVRPVQSLSVCTGVHFTLAFLFL